MLLALAITSTRGWIRQLGKKWTQLHRLIYAAALTALIHFWLVGKVLVNEVAYWAIALALLLGFRVWWTLRTRVRVRPTEAIKG
jgi:sulfoxide reductase heme-binding subunit YedZ